MTKVLICMALPGQLSLNVALGCSQLLKIKQSMIKK